MDLSFIEKKDSVQGRIELEASQMFERFLPDGRGHMSISTLLRYIHVPEEKNKQNTDFRKKVSRGIVELLISKSPRLHPQYTDSMIERYLTDVEQHVELISRGLQIYQGKLPNFEVWKLARGHFKSISADHLLMRRLDPEPYDFLMTTFHYVPAQLPPDAVKEKAVRLAYVCPGGLIPEPLK